MGVKVKFPLALVAVLVLASLCRAVAVPGTANPYLASPLNTPGDTSHDIIGVTAALDGTIPPFINVSGISSLSFSVTGQTANFPNLEDAAPTPDGRPRDQYGNLQPSEFGPLGGISTWTQPVNALVGIFMGDTVGAAPAPSNYAPSLPSYSPSLQQVFFIGDGLTGTGTGARQSFFVPSGATKLYFASSDGHTWGQNSGAFSVSVNPPPPAPPALNSPEAQTASYTFLFGAKPHFQWQPITLGLDFNIALPGVTAFDYNPTVSYPSSPLEPDISAAELKFTTNSRQLGDVLTAISPLDFELLSATGTAGVSADASARAGLFLQDGSTNAKIGADIGAGINLDLSLRLQSDALNVLPGRVKSFFEQEIDYSYPIVGTPTFNLPQADVPIGATFPMLAMRTSLADALHMPVSAIKGTVSYNGIDFAFSDTNSDGEPDQVVVGLGVSAKAFAQTSATAGVDVYVHSLPVGSVQAPITNQLRSIFDNHVTFSAAETLISDTGTVNIGANDLRLNTGSPVWATSLVTVTKQTNVLTFDATFVSPGGADAVLSVYWSDQLVATIEEASAGTDDNTYVFALPMDYEAGNYLLSFRMDPLSDSSSSVTIDSVITGFLAVPEPSTACLLMISLLLRSARRSRSFRA